MENISFPENDTYEKADNTGFKWRVLSNHKSIHTSVYNVTFRSGSNVYPTITKAINIRFELPLTLEVRVADNVVFETSGLAGEKKHFEQPACPAGYYISDFEEQGIGLRTQTKENGVIGYDFIPFWSR